jgi:hypothetical protein
MSRFLKYRVPNPFRSFEEAQRFEQLDLSYLDDLALWRERKRVEDALAYERSERNCIWLVERLGAIRREERYREESRRWI